MQIRVFIADDNLLIREGLKSLLARYSDLQWVGEADESSRLSGEILRCQPDVVFLNYAACRFRMEDIATVRSFLPEAHVLAITDLLGRTVLENALRTGLSGHLLKECDEQEIVDAVRSVVNGDKFYCGKILDAMREDTHPDEVASCAPVKLSPREIEIIRLIAEGNTNKEIADQLFLSTHTVMTHRKNIMNKLGLNNTAGIVIYAVRENIISPNKFLFASN